MLWCRGGGVWKRRELSDTGAFRHTILRDFRLVCRGFCMGSTSRFEPKTRLKEGLTNDVRGVLFWLRRVYDLDEPQVLFCMEAK